MAPLPISPRQEPVSVTAYFTKDGRCLPRALVYEGENLVIDDILEERRERERWIWIAHTIGGLTFELTFDVATLRWTAGLSQAMV